MIKSFLAKFSEAIISRESIANTDRAERGFSQETLEKLPKILVEEMAKVISKIHLDEGDHNSIGILLREAQELLDIKLETLME